MNRLKQIKADPFQQSFYSVLRYLERNSPGKPRIGDSVTTNDDVVTLSQDPYTAFPSSNLSGVDKTANGVLRLQLKFLGMFGPHGALPLHVTETTQIWDVRDPSFRHFVDIFSTRFQQLFYRAWADARPIAQFERPKEDRFQVYLGSFAGIGTVALRNEDDAEQVARISHAGLVNSHVKSAARLKQLLQGVLKIDVDVLEWIGVWLALGNGEKTSLGRNSASLGMDCIVGNQVYSISERFRIRIRCQSLEQYESLLPGSAQSDRLANLIFYYVGYRNEFDVELGLKRSLAKPLRLGKSGRLGLTAWTKTVPSTVSDDEYLYDARFDPFGRRRRSAT